MELIRFDQFGRNSGTDEKLAEMPRTWREKEEEDGDCDGRTVLREIWKEEEEDNSKR